MRSLHSSRNFILNRMTGSSTVVQQAIRFSSSNVAVSFKKVSFGYTDTKLLLDDVSFNIRDGKFQKMEESLGSLVNATTWVGMRWQSEDYLISWVVSEQPQLHPSESLSCYSLLSNQSEFLTSKNDSSSNPITTARNDSEMLLNSVTIFFTHYRSSILGAKVTIMGQNGAGKSSIIKLLNGMLQV